MPKKDTDLVKTDLSTAWGLIELYERTTSPTGASIPGALVKRYKVTAAEVENLHNGGPIPRVPTPDQDLYHFAAMSRPLNVGECVENPDGTLVINHGITETADDVVVDNIEVEAANWDMPAGLVRLEDHIEVLLKVGRRGG